MTTCRLVADDGAVVVIEAERDLLDVAPSYFPPLGLTPATSGPLPTVSLRIELTPARHEPIVIVDGSTVAGGWDRFESELALFAADHLVGRIAIHAGVVSWNGRGLLLPGPSRAGKSTLCAALAAMGCVVYSDEYAIVDADDDRVVPFARPMRLRNPDGTRDRRPLAAVDRPPLPIGVIAAITFDAAVECTELVDATAGAAVQCLMANTVSARRHPELALSAVTGLARTAPYLEGARGDAVEAAESLVRRLRGEV